MADSGLPATGTTLLMETRAGSRQDAEVTTLATWVPQTPPGLPLDQSTILLSKKGALLFDSA
jgi:hypothetical protein